MIDPRQPKFQWGQRVVASVDLFNDGGFPEREPDEQLVASGEQGEIVQIGMHSQTQTPIYLVEFSAGVIGCLEEEIELVGVVDETQGQEVEPPEFTP